MCLIIEPTSLINIKIDSILMNLLWKDVRDYEEFKPFVEFTEESEWMTGLKRYCEKTKKDINQYLKNAYTINPIELGASGMTAIVPHHICWVDVIDKTEIYLVWCKCINEYLKNLTE